MSGFDICADVGVATSNVLGIVSTTPDESGTVFVSDPTATAANDNGAGGFFNTVKIPVSGLNPRTKYYYNVKINGLLDPSRWQSLTTAPTPGVGTAHRIGITSCNIQIGVGRMLVFDAMANMGIDFHLQVGDIDYSNITVNDITLQRRRNQRLWRMNPHAQQIIRVAPHVYIPDDHDTANNAASLQSFTGADLVMANTRTVYEETTPHWPYADASKRVLAQSSVFGNTRYIVLDAHCQRTNTGPRTTVLGDNNAPVGGFDQLQWLKDQISAAVSAGNNRVFVISPTGIPDAISLGWRDYAATEFAEVCTYIRDHANGLVDFITGDFHVIGVDDGTHMDFSTGGGLKARMICSSAAYRSPAIAGPWSWLGASTMWNDCNQNFVILDVAADGSWVATPYSIMGSTLDTMISRGSFRTQDLAA